MIDSPASERLVSLVHVVEEIKLMIMGVANDQGESITTFLLIEVICSFATLKTSW